MIFKNKILFILCLTPTPAPSPQWEGEQDFDNQVFKSFLLRGKDLG
jgi:hypothetical protein